MTYQLRLLLLALQFFTRIPVKGRLAAWVGYTPLMLRESAAYFPLVGALVAGVAAAVLVLGLNVFGTGGYGPLLASGLSLATTLLLTGAFHEDGLTDTIDGLGGSLQRDKALAIMQDSRIGSFGAAGLFVVLGLKWASVAEVSLVDEEDPAWTLFTVLLAAHVLSRAAALAVIACLSHVQANGQRPSKSKPLADQLAPRTLWMSVLWVFLLLVPVFIEFDAIYLVACLVAVAITTLVLIRWFKTRIGGFTGDCLGATQQFCELAVYLVTAAFLA